MPERVSWSQEMDGLLLQCRGRGMSWMSTGMFVGVQHETAKRRFRQLCPGVPTNHRKAFKSKGRKRANASPLVFVSAAQFRDHQLHGSNDTHGGLRRVENSLRSRAEPLRG